jgi:transaldolase
MIEDIVAATDEFRPLFDKLGRRDGFVSLEVSPQLAYDTLGTIDEARRLLRAVDRPNVMIKVPGTTEGAIAVRALIADGINVNITLLFSLDAHRRVIHAYVAGLGDRQSAGKPVDRVASVASFFVSRVDTEVDNRLDALAATKTGAERDRVLALRGKAAIANAKLAYQLFRDEFAASAWTGLRAANARVQRPLWASTGVKNPAYRDVMYVEQLTGPDTVNTMPPALIDAFRDHGEVRRTVDEDIDGARRTLADLAAVGIDLRDVTDKLLRDGLASFQKSFDSLTAGLAKKTATLGREMAPAR